MAHDPTDRSHLTERRLVREPAARASRPQADPAVADAARPAPPATIKGRGTPQRPQSRFEAWAREAIDDGWGGEPEAGEPTRPRTTVTEQRARSILTRNDSPDIGFSQSINPYQGCEHGCIYCYARPSHAYLGLSPGIDFETKLFAKPNAAELLREELAHPAYRCETVMLGANTDPYQPIERERKITRAVLEVLAACDHPVAIVTKGALVERDLDLLASMAERRLARVTISLPTLDHGLARHMEPRATAPLRRLETMRRLAACGVPVGVLVAPIIPAINDMEIERVLEEAAAAGAREAGYTIVRLPREVRDLFHDWLERHFPMRAKHVVSLIRDLRGGKDNESAFFERMKGQGLFGELIRQRFAKACARLGLDRRDDGPGLDTTRFRPPRLGPQLDLF